MPLIDGLCNHNFNLKKRRFGAFLGAPNEDNFFFFIIHFREKLSKQNTWIMYSENVFVCEDFLSTVNKTSYRK